MNTRRYVLSQLLGFAHRETLAYFAQRYGAHERVRHFGCRQQLTCMFFAQLTWREGLRDIADRLNARPLFRWIKQHLRIKHYYGNSANAVKTQIWIALCVYLQTAILHKELKLHGTLHRTLQVLSIHPFEKVPICQLLAEHDFNISLPHSHN